MASPAPLELDTNYHVFNRGTNGENLFLEHRNYEFFLERYHRYVGPVADTYAYCLMRNHLHLLLRTKTPEQQIAGRAERSPAAPILQPSRQLGHLFNSYAKAVNSAYGRSGSLFEHPFHRIEVKSESHLQCLVAYVHRNPQHHGFVSDFRDWPYSSFGQLASRSPTALRRETVLGWFGGLSEFLEFHGQGESVAQDTVQEIALEPEPTAIADHWA